jgi:small subunit ribosomal protein S6
MKKYEVMYIIRPEVDEEGRAKVIEEVNGVFTSRDSSVDKVTEWGMRDLAYEIAGCNKGYYVLLDVTATPEAIKEFDRVANIREQVIRHIAVVNEPLKSAKEEKAE